MNVGRVRIALLAAGLAFAALAVLAQEGGYLDLTDPVPRRRIHSPTGGGSGGFCGGGGGDPTAVPETTVTLVGLDKREYSIGEEVTFEVKVENTGRHDIEIPWSPHLGDLEPSDPTRPYTYRTALLILTLTDPDSHQFLTLGDRFYGSTEVPGTIRELRPSQSVLIRMRKSIEIYDDWWGKRIKEVQPLLLEASPNLMLNEMTYSPSETGDLGSESARCTPMNTKRPNQLDVFLWPRSSK